MNHHKHRRSRTSSSGSSNSHYRRKRSRKHRRRSRSGSSSSGASSIGPKKTENQNTAWENIVIHYLSKLKNYWTSGYSAKPPSNRNSDVEVVPGISPKDPDNINLLGNHPSFEQENYCLAGKRKALNIVSNALEYGLANGIVSQNGNYFWIKDKLVPKSNISNPRMSPSKCGSCRCNSINTKIVDIIDKKSTTESPPKLPKTALSKKSARANIGKKVGIRKKRLSVGKAKKIRKKRGPVCTGFLNKCKCFKCKHIFSLL